MEEQLMFPKIGSMEKDIDMPMTVESLCMVCEEKGITKMLMVKIPYFQEVVIMSFECGHCGNRNNEIQSVGPVQTHGIRIEVRVTKEDLNRQVVKTKSALVRIPDLDFEIPAFSQGGELSTIEGILERAVSSLEQHVPIQKVLSPEQAEKLDKFIQKLRSCRDGLISFTFVLDDISGNSFVENPLAPKSDDAMTITNYERTKEQNQLLGLDETRDVEVENASDEFDANDEVLEFPTDCPRCKCPTTTKMKAVDIPHFKQVIIMSIDCSNCGERSNEVKSGGGIEAKGSRIELLITDPTDLCRDVLKSDTCVLQIPELEFELESGTLGGRFTTVEGLLVNIKGSLEERNPFFLGDSSSENNSLKKFLTKLNEVIEGKRQNIHVILDDPAGNSFIQNVYAPEDDPNMKTMHYERTPEQNENLGISEEMLLEFSYQSHA